MKVIVCGGRDYADAPRVFSVLDLFAAKSPISLVIEGGASGADQWARAWADSRGIHRATCPANWKAHGKAAGPKRNKAMLALGPDVVIAFPGGSGTANMVGLAIKQGTQVYEIAEFQQ